MTLKARPDPTVELQHTDRRRKTGALVIGRRREVVVPRLRLRAPSAGETQRSSGQARLPGKAGQRKRAERSGPSSAKPLTC